MLQTLISIGLGGALGAMARHGMNTGITALVKAPFPYGTLCINVIGSFLIGAFIAIFAGYWNPGKLGQLFLVTGFLGGFTTFSAFSLDAMTLFTKGDMLGAAAYISGSVILSIAAVFGGNFLVWKIIA